MANTLKFGTDGKWATKKGSTLAYNSENGNYKPLPFTFDRASSATRVNKDGLIETVGSGQPRIDYKDDSKGALLLEPSRTNYILKSDDVLSTYGSQNGDVSDASEPINGFNNSIQIEYDASNSLVYKRDFTPTIGTEYTISCFIQMNGNSEPIHTVDVNSGDFSLINEGGFANPSDIKTERLGSTNVYRVSSTRTATGTNNRFGMIKYSTQSSKGFKVTGFQVEQGSYATSYIPTQGSIGTRLQEDSVKQILTNSVVGQTQGTIFYDINMDNINSNSQYVGVVSDGTSSNRIQFLNNSSQQWQLFISASTISNNISLTTNTSGVGRYKIAIAYESGNVAYYINGVQKGTSSETFTFSNLLHFDLGQRYDDNLFLDNSINETKLYNTRLSNTELQALTTI